LENRLNINSVIGDLVLIDASLDTSDNLTKVYSIFEKDAGIPGIIVMQEKKFFGFLSRMHFFEIMSKQFMYDLFSKRTVDFFFAANYKNKYLILPSSTSVISAVNIALQRKESEIFEPLVVQFDNNEYRILDFYNLILAQNTIQQLMNSLLQKANDFKQEVLAIVAHDLRNPIGVILGFSSLISELDDVVKLKEYAGHINKTAGQMEDMVNNFLISAINNSVEFDLIMTWFDMNELLTTIVRNFDHMTKKKSQTLIFNYEPNAYKAFSDKIRLKEVFENLISNAIKYSGTGKEIIVSLSKKDEYFVFIVKDQGPGFTKKDLEKIFGKFQRLSAQPTNNESSTGLGLFITKQIVDKLKGKIDIESKMGEGSTFTISLPIAAGN